MKRIILFTLLFFPAIKIFAYSPETTHAGLAEQSVIFYDQNFSRQITDAEGELIVMGSREEDRPVARSLNHFYDPTRNIGINGFRTAKDWATEDFNGNDFTWRIAIDYYAKGDEETAFIALGHILHLIEDMTVPDHTRNDPHMGDGPLGLGTGESSYEKWAKVAKNKDTLSTLALSYRGLKPVFFTDIRQFFDFLANYSNHNFFGDDSINNNVYQYSEPKITKYDNGYAYGVDQINGASFKLLIAKENKDGTTNKTLIRDNDFSVLSGYFDRLGKQAILAGAGVIDLFLREAEAARSEYLEKQKEALEAETLKAAVLNKSLQNANITELAWYGLTSSVKDEVVLPFKTIFANSKNNFSSGAKVAVSGLKNVSSFTTFTTTAFAKQAANKVADIFASPKETQNTASQIAVNNLPSISVAMDNAIEPSISHDQNVVEQPTSEVDNITSEGNIEPVEIITPATDYSLELLSAYFLLSELKDLLPIPAPRRVSVAATYSPGFGGGASPAVVDNPVDKLVENQKESINTTQEEIASPKEDPSEKEEITVESTPELEPEIIPKPEPEPALEEEVILPILDITSPDVSLNIDSCSDSISEDGCLLATTTIKASWSSGVPDLDYFEINNDDGISTTTDISIYFNVTDKTSHIFSVAAIDKTGNISDSVSKSFQIFKAPVVINEVAWGGTSGHSEDEWIELYNLSDKSIDLDGWRLYSKTDNSPNINLSGKISPYGYYLIERKNDGEEDEVEESPVKNVTADLWTSFGVGLSNAGENLVLSRASTTMDEVPYSINWTGGSAGRSSERNFGGGIYPWTSNNGEIIRGYNVDGLPIYGTPGTRNSSDYLIKLSSGSSNLSVSKSPYFVPKNAVLVINEGATLNIEPGVVIKFGDGSSIKADGKISSNGTKDKPIVFTAFSDDVYGGDMNNDGTCGGENATTTTICPSAGKWYGIIMSSKATDSKFANTIFRYGGLNYGTKKGMVYADSVALDLTDSIFEYSGSNAVTLKNVIGQILGNTFRNNKTTPTAAGLSVTTGAPTIKNNNFISNSVGLYLCGSDAVIIDNSFDGNMSKGVDVLGRIGGEMIGNNSISGSGKTGDLINLSGNIVNPNSTTTLVANPMPYFINGTLIVPAGGVLNIYEGVKMMGINSGAASRLLINGDLHIFGSEEKPVVFSSNQEPGTKGGWLGLVMNPGSRGEIKNAVFRDATTAITYIKSPLILENVLFSNNQLGVSIGQIPSPVEKIVNITFGLDNTASTSPRGIF